MAGTEAATGRMSPPSSPEDPVIQSLPVAIEAAPGLCRKDPVTGESCSWYHGFWPYLRVFGLAATPQRHGKFFAEMLGRLARDGQHRRVLVSGTADYAMLAHILLAYRDADPAPEISVVDRCETPLFLCKWYMERVCPDADIELKTKTTDILNWDTEDRFDMLCCHSFLSQFSNLPRQALIAKWRHLLRPGGKVVTTTRIDPAWTPQAAVFSPDQIASFGDRVYRESCQWREKLGIDPDEVAAAAKRYAERTRTNCIGSLEELRELFETGGFKFDHLMLSHLEGKAPSSQSGPGLNRQAVYAEIVASRA